MKLKIPFGKNSGDCAKPIRHKTRRQGQVQMTLYDSDGNEVEGGKPDLAAALFIEGMLSGPSLPMRSFGIVDRFPLHLG